MATVRAIACDSTSKKMNKKARVQPKKTQKKTRPRVRKLVVASAPKKTLSACARKYLTAVLDPFDPRALGACVPVGNNSHSWKGCFRVVTTLTIGTQGIGTILVCPNTANDQGQMLLSNSTYTGTPSACTIQGATDTAATEYVMISAMPYTYANLTGATSVVGGRVVACGLRIRYTGTENDRGGTIYAAIAPDREDLTGATIANLSQFPQCAVVPVSDKYFQISMGPGSTDDTFYSNALNGNIFTFSRGLATPHSTASSISYAGPMGLIVQAKAATTFLVEYIIHVEYSGRSAAPFSSPSDSDAEGYSAVTNVVNAFYNAIATVPMGSIKEKAKIALGWASSLHHDMSEVAGAIQSIWGAVAPVALSVGALGATAYGRRLLV